MFPYFLGGTQPKETKAIEVKGPEHSRFPSSRLHRAPGGRSGLSCKYLHVTKKYLYAADFDIFFHFLGRTHLQSKQ